MNPTIVYVIMGNDFPECVFSTLELAEAYVKWAKAQDKLERPWGPPIYWRVYPFPVRDSL